MNLRRSIYLGLLGSALMLGACNSEDGEETHSHTSTPTAVALNEPIDERRYDVPPPPEGGIQIVTEDMIVPSGGEIQKCHYFDLSEYADQIDGHALNFGATYQNTEFGHHAAYGYVTDPEFLEAPGTVTDCLSVDAEMFAGSVPIFLGVPTQHDAGINLLDLDDGFGLPYPEGEQVVYITHYTNTSAHDVVVNDHINLGFIPNEEVETWVTGFVSLAGAFELPAGQGGILTMDCTVRQDVSVMILTGHMHETGISYLVERTTADGEHEILYDVNPWEDTYREIPPINEYEDGELHFKRGDVITTTCDWFNHTQDDMIWPTEMCMTVGYIYPSQDYIVCADDDGMDQRY